MVALSRCFHCAFWRSACALPLSQSAGPDWNGGCDPIVGKSKQSRKRHLHAKGGPKGRVNHPSTTTRNQISENSPAEENFLGGPPVVYWPGLRVIRTANTLTEGCRSSEWDGFIRSSSWSTSTIRCSTTTAYSRI